KTFLWCPMALSMSGCEWTALVKPATWTRRPRAWRARLPYCDRGMPWLRFMESSTRTRRLQRRTGMISRSCLTKPHLSKSSKASENLNSVFPREKKVFDSDFPMFHGRRRLSFPDLKSSFAVKYWKLPFSNISREKEIFNSNFPMFHGRRRLSFPDLKSSFAVKYWKLPFSNISREKEIFNSNFPMFHGRRRLSFPDLKSSFGVKYWEFPVFQSFAGSEDLQFQFPDVSRQKETVFSGFEVFFRREIL